MIVSQSDPVMAITTPARTFEHGDDLKLPVRDKKGSRYESNLPTQSYCSTSAIGLSAHAKRFLTEKSNWICLSFCSAKHRMAANDCRDFFPFLVMLPIISITDVTFMSMW